MKRLRTRRRRRLKRTEPQQIRVGLKEERGKRQVGDRIRAQRAGLAAQEVKDLVELVLQAALVLAAKDLEGLVMQEDPVLAVQDLEILVVMVLVGLEGLVLVVPAGLEDLAVALVVPEELVPAVKGVAPEPEAVELPEAPEAQAAPGQVRVAEGMAEPVALEVPAELEAGLGQEVRAVRGVNVRLRDLQRARHRIMLKAAAELKGRAAQEVPAEAGWAEAGQEISMMSGLMTGPWGAPAKMIFP